MDPGRRDTALMHDPALMAKVAVTQAGNPVHYEDHVKDSQDDRVRTVLARRIATLLPTLDEANQTELRRHVLTMLFKLVADECIRVRAAIADVLKDMPGVPRDLILRLAADTDVSVCEPVIRLSPVLTEEDLLTLLRTPPSPDTATAIARRPDLTEALSDEIAATAGSAAVRTLLANGSAAIREATLNALIARAAKQMDWQEPLVRRPRLSAAAAAALSAIVTTRLLEYLARREDLPAPVTEELRLQLASRPRIEPPSGGFTSDMTSYQALQVASQMRVKGSLHEVDLQEALVRGEARFATAILAVAAGVSLAVVDRATALRSAKGLISLVWKAGFSMQAAASLQVLLARLSPSDVLLPGPGGSFPLMVAEMRWQLAFLNRLTRSGSE